MYLFIVPTPGSSGIGSGLIMHCIWGDSDNEWIPFYKATVTVKTQNRDGYTSSIQWEDEDGSFIDFDSGSSFVFDCIGVRGKK